MRTIKEMSDLTGISVRMLRYYDQTGLLKPTDKSEAGYRLYDDKALEDVQQILFFREFDIPLKEIKSVMENPALDKNRILKMQRNMLLEKKRHLEHLIESIEYILKGEHQMNQEICNQTDFNQKPFTQEDVEHLYESLISNMSKAQRHDYIKTFIKTNEALSTEEKKRLLENCDMETFHRLFVQSASGERAQKNFQKMVEWYGDKESAMAAGTTPTDPQIFKAYQNRLDNVMKKLAAKRGADVSSFEVKELVGEYDFVSKQLYQVRDAKKLVQDLARFYEENETAGAALDTQYGEGTSDFFVRSVNEFYKD